MKQDKQRQIVNAKRLAGALAQVVYSDNPEPYVRRLAMVLNYNPEQLYEDMADLVKIVEKVK